MTSFDHIAGGAEAAQRALNEFIKSFIGCFDHIAGGAVLEGVWRERGGVC